MDVIRKIVLALDDAPDAINAVDGLDKVAYLVHARSLIEAGLAEGAVAKSGTSHVVPSHVMLFRLTWAGQDFAQAIRDDTLWKKARDNLLKPGASWTFDVLLGYLRMEIKRHVPGLDQLL